MKKGLGANVDFKLGQPFRPFQQLMGVLPDRSKKIVPTAYWSVESSGVKEGDEVYLLSVG